MDNRVYEYLFKINLSNLSKSGVNSEMINIYEFNNY